MHDMLMDYLFTLVTWVAEKRKTPGARPDAAAVDADRLRRYERRHPGITRSITADVVSRLLSYEMSELICKLKSAKAKRRQNLLLQAILDPFGFFASPEGYKLIVREINNAMHRHVNEVKRDEAVRDDFAIREGMLQTGVVKIPEQLINALEREEQERLEQAAAEQREAVEAKELRKVEELANQWYRDLSTARRKEIARLLIRAPALSDREIALALETQDRHLIAQLRAELQRIVDRIITLPPEESESEIGPSADQPDSRDEHIAVNVFNDSEWEGSELDSDPGMDGSAIDGWLSSDSGASNETGAALKLSGGNQASRAPRYERDSTDSADYTYAPRQRGSGLANYGWNQFRSERWTKDGAVQRSRSKWDDPAYWADPLQVEPRDVPPPDCNVVQINRTRGPRGV
jgi:hypothetical protein